MKFENETDKKNYIEGKEYFKSLDNYCLGKNLSEAANVVKLILNAKKRKKKA